MIAENNIRNGQDLVAVFVLGSDLNRDVNERQILAQEAFHDAIDSTVPMPDTAAVTLSQQATEKCVRTVLATRDHSRAAEELAELNDHISGQVIGRKVVAQSISWDVKPVSVYARHPDKPIIRHGRPKRRHRIAGTITGLDVAQSELIVKPRLLSRQGIFRDYSRVAMLDARGEPLVHLELLDRRTRLRNIRPVLSRQLAKVTG